MARGIAQTGWLLVSGLLASACSAGTAPHDAARGLIQRLVPEKAALFVLESIPQENGRDVFEIESRDGKVVIRGSSGVSIASGWNWYLKYYCRCHVSLWGNQLRLPDPLPVVNEKVRRSSPFRYRYYLNFCAFSYSLAWWDWAQWERLIDWMALHGINMPLSVTGQEAIWQKVYGDLGLNDKQLGEFFVGPGYLPFGWMGCIDGWGGPLPKSWIESHLALQKKIVARQRELGMTPVLQGFTGHVPAALKEVIPAAKLQRLPSWCNFPPTYFVDPQDPLFVRIGKLFIEEQTRQFGTDHLYASDTFIEMPPPSNDPQFLAAMGKGVYEAMRAADPEAVWVMQGWVFVNAPQFWKHPQGRALLGAVPDDRMILLDLACENMPAWSRTESFYGKPWIWAVIQDYGGVVSLHGGLPQLAGNLREALAGPKRGQVTGIGLVNEALGYNAIVNDFIGEMTWRTEVPELTEWLPDFVHGRYGSRPAAAQEAWDLLLKTAYRASGNTGSVVCTRPCLEGSRGCAGAGPTPYDSLHLSVAWQKLLSCAEQLGGTETYRFDLVHLTRQVLANLALQFRQEATAAYQRKDRQALADAGARFLQLLRDMDQLLATREEFLLGKWLADARRWAANDEERRLYEWNARTIVTLWGPRDSGLHEYANKQWSGMLTSFYLPRWEMFYKQLDAALEAGKPADAAAWENSVRDWEVQWARRDDNHAAVPAGDAVALSRKLWTDYARFFAPEAPSLTTGKPVSCSAALPEYPATFANDGRKNSTDRYWATDVRNDKEAWWQVDLEQPATVGRVVVVLYYGDRRHYGFKVETSNDGKTWDMAADRRDNTELSTAAGHTCQFAPRQVRYIRVTVTSNSANTGRHLVEVMAFEK
ncbi:MAG: alpha-N-acetylglucosaminidase C-terminal domain-containing protein [Planctomycetota bacterium]|nr:alpha-N-acetylglucosaminidase C-terminal domain-containing protein [Planctomycetota bacterium]